MAINLELLRATVKADKVEKVLTEADLEAEKTRLRDEILQLKTLPVVDSVDSLNLNKLRQQSATNQLAELEAKGLEAMLTDEQKHAQLTSRLNELHAQGLIGNHTPDSEE